MGGRTASKPSRARAAQALAPREDGLASAQFRFDTPQLAAGSFIQELKGIRRNPNSLFVCICFQLQAWCQAVPNPSRIDDLIHDYILSLSVFQTERQN